MEKTSNTSSIKEEESGEMTRVESACDDIQAGRGAGKSKSIYALGFATAVSFMGIGLVDPILPSISHSLNASPTQAMLLFTSYLVITAMSMFFTFWISSAVGVRRTLIFGLIIVVLCSAASGASNTVNHIIEWRAFWGLGNALFISTALAAIVNSSKGRINDAIIMYESAIGIGMAVGPLAGGMLGHISWRGPFAGTSMLMAIACISIFILYRDNHKSGSEPVPTGDEREEKMSPLSAFKALKDKSLRTLSLIALFYNMTFFVVLAYSPFPIERAAKDMGMEFGAIHLGFVFFAWGILLAVTSIWIAPIFSKKFGLFNTVRIAFIILVLLMIGFVLLSSNLVPLIICVVLSGFAFGLLNTTLTETVMEINHFPRGVISSAYSGVRFFGGAVSSALAGPLAKATFESAPYLFGMICTLAACVFLHLAHKNIKEMVREKDLDAITEAEAIGMGDE